MMASVEDYPFADIFRQQESVLSSNQLFSFEELEPSSTLIMDAPAREGDLNSLQQEMVRQENYNDQKQLQHSEAFFFNAEPVQIDEKTFIKGGLISYDAPIQQVNPTTTVLVNHNNSYATADIFTSHNPSLNLEEQFLSHHQQQQQQQQQVQIQDHPYQPLIAAEQFNYVPFPSQQYDYQEPLAQKAERSRYMSEPNLLTPTARPNSSDSSLLMTPQSLTYNNFDKINFNSNTSGLDSPEVTGFNGQNHSGYQRYKVIRGVSSGSAATKPPKIKNQSGYCFLPVQLELAFAQLEELCLPQWDRYELEDKRRIIRIERHQVGSKIIAEFSIVGSAKQNPDIQGTTIPGVDVVEVSCLESYTRPGDDSDDEVGLYGNHYSYGQLNETKELKREFYITSVEVLKIVELLVGTGSRDSTDIRRERGRIRSNLVPFWSKKPISSKLPSVDVRSSPIASEPSQSFRMELATRIMAYEIRKPRGFDKEVRILKWDKLAPALRRALACYYAEVPNDFPEN